MPAESKAQRRFFGFLKGHPAEAERRGISAKTVDEFVSTKEKGLPDHVGSKNLMPTKRKRQ